MPTEQSTSNGRTAEASGRQPRSAIASSDILDTDQLLAVLTAVQQGRLLGQDAHVADWGGGQDLATP